MLQISRHLDSSKDATGARTGVVKLSIRDQDGAGDADCMRPA